MVALLVTGRAVLAPAAAAERHAAMVIDANSGQVLFAQAADAKRYPASLTKMMTLYIVFELIEQGRLARDARIRISPTAAATAPSKLGLEPGSDIGIMDAVKVIITKSANDIAVAVAEHIAGSEAKFAALMTRKAHALGMTATTFRNPHGLPDSGQVTTARDMLTLALRLSDDFPKHYHLFGLKAFSYGGSTYRNHNTMLLTYPGMDGLKTGFTTMSGFNLVASVRRNGKHLVAAVFGGQTAGARNAQMRTILDRAMLRASSEKTRKPVLVARAEKRDRAARKVAEAPAPALVEAVRPAERPRVAAAPASQPAPVAAPAGIATPPAESVPAAAAPTPVAIARVRPVLIAPKQRPNRDVAADTGSERLTGALRTTEPPAAPVEATPSPPVPAAAASAAPILPSAAPPAPVAVPPANAMPPTGRGLAPSSLQAQAQRLRRGDEPLPGFDKPTVVASAAPSPTYRLRGPEPPPTARAAAPAVAGGVALQVGAFASEAEAHRHLDAARGMVGALKQAQATTQPVQQGGKQLYRARFVGLDAASAAGACTDLRRAQIDCLVAPIR